MTTKRSPMPSDEYTSLGGTCCPNCRSDSIEGDEVVVESGTASQAMYCLSCFAEWADHYQRVCYDELKE